MSLVLAANAVLAACTSPASPELACQNRIVAVRDGPMSEADPFQSAAYAAVDRSGCTAAQIAVLERLTQLAKDLPRLNDRNDAAAIVGGKAHAEAFQHMNDALIELDTLQQQARGDLERMSQRK